MAARGGPVSVGSAVLNTCERLKQKVTDLAGSWPNDLAQFARRCWQTQRPRAN